MASAWRGLSLLWIVVRIAARMARAGPRPVSPRLFENPLSVDRAVRYAVVAGQWLLLAVYVLPGEVLRELDRGIAACRRRRQRRPQAFGPPAWILLAVLGVIAVAALWDRWGRADLVATLLAAATVPCLAAGPMLADRAAASMLRWGLAVAFVVASIVVWQRHRLAGPCGKARAWIAVGPEGPAIARTVLLATMALPVVGLTVLAAVVRLSGTLPGGPLAGNLLCPPRAALVRPGAAGCWSSWDWSVSPCGSDPPATLFPPGWCWNWPSRWATRWPP